MAGSVPTRAVAYYALPCSFPSTSATCCPRGSDVCANQPNRLSGWIHSALPRQALRHSKDGIGPQGRPWRVAVPLGPARQPACPAADHIKHGLYPFHTIRR